MTAARPLTKAVEEFSENEADFVTFLRFTALRGRECRELTPVALRAEMLKAASHLLERTNSVRRRRKKKKTESILRHRDVLSQPNPPCRPHMHMFPFCQHIPGAFSQR